MTRCKNCNHHFKGEYSEGDTVYVELTDEFNDTIAVTSQEDDPHTYVSIFGINGEEKVVALTSRQVAELLLALEGAVDDAEWI